MFCVGETSGEPALGAASTRAEDTASAHYLIVSLLRMQAENTSEALSVVEHLATSTSAAAPADPLVGAQSSSKVFAVRQHLFLNALYSFGGVYEHDVDHERGLAYLRDAQYRGCAAAMAVLCADYPNDDVKETCFNVLRNVSCSAAGGFYNSVMVIACRSLCARMIQLKLVNAPEDYVIFDEYNQASEAGCPFASVHRAALLEKRGQFAEAAHGYFSAAKGGNALATYQMARCLRDGIGAEQNSALAMISMEQSSGRGFFWAMYAYAVMLMDAQHSTTRAQDDIEAFNLLHQVAAGVTHAYNHRGPMRCLYLQFCCIPNPHRRLAQCYSEGRGVAQDLAFAERHMALFQSGS
jgi:hypothetical protein